MPALLRAFVPWQVLFALILDLAGLKADMPGFKKACRFIF
jgi:hypothetical protein